MKLRFKSIEFFWDDCSTTFRYHRSIPLFSTGGGSYQDFMFSHINHCQKHFYLYKWCFLTIKYQCIRPLYPNPKTTKLQRALDSL